MTQKIDTDKFIALLIETFCKRQGIDRRYANTYLDDVLEQMGFKVVDGEIVEINKLANEEPASKDLEEEIERYLKHSLAVKFPTTDVASIKADVRYIAHHFANWQKQQMMHDLWHKGSDHPNNKHPYPVLNPDTQEMAFAYYNNGWNFDRDYDPGKNLLWFDIEKILPHQTH